MAVRLPLLVFAVREIFLHFQRELKKGLPFTESWKGASDDFFEEDIILLLHASLADAILFWGI